MGDWLAFLIFERPNRVAVQLERLGAASAKRVCDRLRRRFGIAAR